MDKLSLIKQPVSQDVDRFRELFNSSMSDDNKLLHEVLVHIRKRQGKMMRPILIMLIARLLGDLTDVTLHAAVSLELLHTASLVHDDVVDESGERRGQASVNAIFNNKVSILAGDYILASSLFEASQTNHKEIINVIASLGQELSSGELLQLSNIQNETITEQVYFDVIKKKTAALFSACTSAAAFSIDADGETVDTFRTLGEYIGICFQIRDDLFDYYDSKNVGKPSGNDMREGKFTLPAIYAYLNFGKGNPAIEALVKQIKSGEATNDQINEMIQFVKNNGGMEYAIKVMDDYCDKAKHLLDRFPDNIYKESILRYVDYVVDRDL
jgi:octaprenyl-diphosphate synthase